MWQALRAAVVQLWPYCADKADYRADNTCTRTHTPSRTRTHTPTRTRTHTPTRTHALSGRRAPKALQRKAQNTQAFDIATTACVHPKSCAICRSLEYNNARMYGRSVLCHCCLSTLATTARHSPARVEPAVPLAG